VPELVGDPLERLVARRAHEPIVATPIEELVAGFGLLLAAQRRIDPQPLFHLRRHAAGKPQFFIAGDQVEDHRREGVLGRRGRRDLE